MEKHFPSNGDFPTFENDSTVVSVDVLIRLNTGLYILGFYDYSESLFVEYDRSGDDRWEKESVECWWYLPE